MTARMHALLFSLLVALPFADDGRWITVYCARCGGHYPLGHGH